MADKTALYTEIGVFLVHAMAGRVRLRATGTEGEATLNAIKQALRHENAVCEIHTNEVTGSSIVSFDPIALPLPHLLEVLHSFGVAETPTQREEKQKDPFALWKSKAFWKKQGRSFLPIVAGLLVARGLGLFGWRSLLAYMIAAGTTRQLIDLVDSEKPLDISLASPESPIVPHSAKGRYGRAEGKIIPSSAPIVGAGTGALPLQKVRASEERPAIAPTGAIAYHILHAIPGRVRFGIPRIADDPQYAHRLQKLTESADGVTSVRINSTAGSIVITYDVSAVSPGQMRSRLSDLIQDAGDTKPVKPPPPPPPPPASSVESHENTDIETEEAIAEPAAENTDIETPDQPESPPVLQPAALEAEVEAQDATDEMPTIQAVVLKADIDSEEATSEALLQPPAVLEAETGDRPIEQLLAQPAVLEAETGDRPIEQLLVQPTVLEADVSDRPIEPKSVSKPIVEEPVNLWLCLWQTIRSTVKSLRTGQPPMNALISGLRDAGAIPS